MNRKQKIQYFFDYYFVKTAVALVLTGAVVYLVWNYVRPQPQTALYVALMDEDLKEEEQQELTEELNRLFQVDGKKERVVLDDSFYMMDGGLDKLQVYLFNRQIDVVIADRSLYTELAGLGYFQDMNEVLKDKRGDYEERYLMAAGYKDNEEISFEDNETGRGEPLPYGVELSSSDRYMALERYVQEPVFAVAQGAPNEKNAVEFLDYLSR